MGYARELGEIVANAREFNERPNVRLVKKAFGFAKKAHAGQKRASREDYFVHPVKTALILSRLGADSETIAAAFLHDVLEDTETKRFELLQEFGEEVACLVEGVTKLGSVSKAARERKQLYNLHGVLLASVSDMRVLFIKLADKLHNLETIGFLPAQKRKEIAEFALKVYVPLAHRLGIHSVKREMEDLCFEVVEPRLFARLKREVLKRRKRKAVELGLVERQLKKNPSFRGFGFYLQEKSVFQIFTKMVERQKTFDEIHDYVTLVVLAPSVGDCYKALGLVHKLFPPVTRKLKDFIAIPQSNAYRAIHTSVIGPSGEPIKFYIRTREMDALDESGFVRMGLLGREKVREFNKKLGLLKRSFSEDMKEEPKTAVEMVSSDLDDIMIFFDKNGKPFEMPANSTSLDFAFSLSSSRGLRFSYALVNGKRVPPWYEIQPSDIVEIVTLKKPQARKEWLEFVRLKKSKKSILDYLARGRRKQKKRETEFVTIKVSALDRVGLFHAIADVFAANKVNISSISAGSDGTRKSANMLFKIEIGSPKQLSMLLKRLNAIKSVTRTEIVASEKKRQKGYSM